MAAKWQQWMPFYIDRFKASPAVQSMQPTARMGYLYLLTCCWQSEDCTLPGDEESLIELSGLGEELWKEHGPRILRKFGRGPDNRLLNPVLLDEWKEAKRIFEARQASAHHTNTARTQNGHRAVTAAIPSRPADTRTGTVTVTNTEVRKAFARSVPPEELAGTLPLANGTDFSVSKSDVDRWVQAFPGVSVKQELKKFKAWCEDNPTRKKTAKGVKSAVFRWLDKAQNSGGGNGIGEQSKKRTEGNVGTEGGEDGPDLYAALYGPLEQGKLN